MRTSTCRVASHVHTRGARSPQARRRLAAAATVALGLFASSVPLSGAGVLTDTLPPLSPEVTSALQTAEPFLEAPPASPPPLPSNPTAALLDVLKSLSLELGVPKDPIPTVVKAALSPEITGTLALTLYDVLSCQRISKAHLKLLSPTLKAVASEYGNGGGLSPAHFADIRNCAKRLWKSTTDLERALTRAVLPLGADLDFWPIVRYSRSTTASNTYSNDYLLQIDAGGDDTYNNAAGSSLVDVNFGPPGQPGLKGVGPAKGCQRAIPGITAADCVPAAGVLIDLGGNDAFGVRQAPDVDAECTTDPVVRRMVTNGSGFLGVGILLDRSGDDVYTGKTVSNGAGHVGGVGMLHDKGGNDRYLEVRNSTGFALVAGLGVARDHAGNDTHDFYMPTKLAGASGVNQTPGAGGVIDDEDACDNLPRYDVGGGNVGGVGVFVDDTGDDTYAGGFAPAFLAPFGSNAGGGSSQGFANNQAAGSLVDKAGNDSYAIFTLSLGGDGTWVRTPHPNSRGNGVTLVPMIDPATQQGGETGTGGVFKDF